MATRNRVIYQSQAVALSGNSVGGGPALIPINGVQSITYGIDVAREDVNQFGKIAAMDRIITEAPTASQEVQFHFPNNSITPSMLNLLIQDSFGTQEDGLVVSLDVEGTDYTAPLDGAGSSSVGLASGRLSSFSLEASVGGIPTITLGFEGVGLNYGSVAVAAPGDYSTQLKTFTDVVVGLASAGGSNTHMTNAQSATISFDLGSEGLQRLGRTGELVYARVPTLPASATLELEGLAVDAGMSLQLAGISTKSSTANVGVDAGGRADVTVTIGTAIFTLKKATLDAVSYSNSIGDNATCSATFSCSVGSTDVAFGLQISGS